jgi:hypothetical protein
MPVSKKRKNSVAQTAKKREVREWFELTQGMLGIHGTTLIGTLSKEEDEIDPDQEPCPFPGGMKYFIPNDSSGWVVPIKPDGTAVEGVFIHRNEVYELAKDRVIVTIRSFLPTQYRPKTGGQK